MSGGSGHSGLAGIDRDGRPRGQRSNGTRPGVTDDPARTAAAGTTEADRETIRRARAIADRLSLPRPAVRERARSAGGDLVSLRYRGRSDDIDVDATVATLAETPLPTDDDVIVRERARTRRAVALLVDVSGSMRGERIRTAAGTVGALAAELSRDDLAIVAFWSDAAVVQHLGTRRDPGTVLEEMLRVPARGLTNVEFPLRIAACQLRGSGGRDARAVLLSDCVHNAGPDPRHAVRGVPRLDVLLDVSGEHDLAMAQELARLGRGRLAIVRTHRDVAPGLSRFFRS